MKRLVLIAISLVFLGYALVIFSTQNILGINRFPYFKDQMAYGRKLSGVGTLFTREKTLINYQTLYQFYHDGKWEPWHILEQETFNRYLLRGNFSELKHTHLDTHLGKDLYFNAYLKKVPLQQSKAYQTLISHLILGHHENLAPDSVRLVYQLKQIKAGGTVSLKNLFTYSASL